MASCTAPVRGHRTASARAECPRCGGGGYNRYGGYGGGYGSYSSPPSYSSSPSYSPPRSGGGGGSSRPRWSRSGSSASYTTSQVQSLTPIRETVEKLVVSQPDLRDVFLCHAWDDRKGLAKELHELLVAAGVKVWFSETDLSLGVPMMRAIDRGLANSRIGLVLVTPALLASVPRAGVADKELSVLLARNQLVPIMHNTTFEELLSVSPMLASRSGLSTAEDSMAVIAEKIADLVTV
jgi:hypothetical protein